MPIRTVVAAVAGLSLGVAATAWYSSDRVNALRAENLVLADESASQKRAYAVVVAASLALEAANLKLAAERDRHKQTIDRQKQSMLKFGSRFAGRTTARFASEVVAIPGRSVPFAGAAVNVGMFTLTVAEACLTMKELNEILREDGERELKVPSLCGIRLPTSVPSQ